MFDGGYPVTRFEQEEFAAQQLLASTVGDQEAAQQAQYARSQGLSPQMAHVQLLALGDQAMIRIQQRDDEYRAFIGSGEVQRSAHSAPPVKSSSEFYDPIIDKDIRHLFPIETRLREIRYAIRFEDHKKAASELQQQHEKEIADRRASTFKGRLAIGLGLKSKIFVAPSFEQCMDEVSGDRLDSPGYFQWLAEKGF